MMAVLFIDLFYKLEIPSIGQKMSINE